MEGEAQQWAKTISKRDMEIAMGSLSRNSPGEDEFLLLQRQFQAVSYTRAEDLAVPSEIKTARLARQVIISIICLSLLCVMA